MNFFSLRSASKAEPRTEVPSETALPPVPDREPREHYLCELTFLNSTEFTARLAQQPKILDDHIVLIRKENFPALDGLRPTILATGVQFVPRQTSDDFDLCQPDWLHGIPPIVQDQDRGAIEFSTFRGRSADFLSAAKTANTAAVNANDPNEQVQLVLKGREAERQYEQWKRCEDRNVAEITAELRLYEKWEALKPAIKFINRVTWTDFNNENVKLFSELHPSGFEILLRWSIGSRGDIHPGSICFFPAELKEQMDALAELPIEDLSRLGTAVKDTVYQYKFNPFQNCEELQSAIKKAAQ